MPELPGDRRAFDDFLEPRGVDVVLDLHSMRIAIFIYQLEPSLHPFEQLNMLAELLEILFPQRDSVFLRLVIHHFHVGKHIAGVLSGSEPVAHFPEFLRGLSYGLDETEFLHVSRG